MHVNFKCNRIGEQFTDRNNVSLKVLNVSYQTALTSGFHLKRLGVSLLTLYLDGMLLHLHEHCHALTLIAREITLSALCISFI